jgi:dihydroorotate dehydrogenase
MDWHELINDFNGLVTELVQKQSQHKVAEALSRDKRTVFNWLRGAAPSEPIDVAWVIRLALSSGIDLSRFQTYASIYDFSSMLSYEEETNRGPDDLSWLTSAQPPPPVKTTFCGLELDGPLGVASSPLLADDKWTSLMLNLGFGLSTFKTKRTTSKQAWFPPHIAYVLEQPDLTKYDARDPAEVLVGFNRKEIRDSVPNLVNSIGVPSETPGEWQEMYERIKRHPRGHLVGISVMGDGHSRRELMKDFELAVVKARDNGPPFIELNLSCPNLRKGAGVYYEPSSVRLLCSKVRKILEGSDILLVIKLPHLPDETMREVLKGAGKYIDAVAFRNTIQVRPITTDRDGRRHPAFMGRDLGGLSGPCTFETTRRGLQRLTQIRSELGQEFQIMAIGGASTPGHVVELMDAGANVVQACTAPMFDPLLAWKVRFHLKQFEHQVSTDVALPFTQPRDQAEIESFRNAFEAYGEIQRRHPERAVPYDVFRAKWNAWMEQRPAGPVGKAHRISAPRTFAEWVRDFTS